MEADQLACVTAITQKRANGAVVTGGCDVCGNKEKLEQRVSVHMFNKRKSIQREPQG